MIEDRMFDGESFDANDYVDFYSICQDKKFVIQGKAHIDPIPYTRQALIFQILQHIDQQYRGAGANQSLFI
jgi:hypothetical protein